MSRPSATPGWEPDADDDGDFDDLPQTHLDDEAYEEFLSRELDGTGRLRGYPPVGVWILIAVAVILGLAIVLLR